MNTLEQIARARRTLKLLPDPDAPLPAGRLSRDRIETLLEAPGWTPFHRPHFRAREQGDPVVEPWRFHLIDAQGCRALIPRLETLPKPPAKIANMLAAADALVMATWLPEPCETDAWDASEFNLEHIAAAAAAVQTFLLAATEAGIGTYWSSGGVLATRSAFELLGIGGNERLIGAVFLFPEPNADVPTAPGKLRARRSGPKGWSRWIDLDAR